MIITKILQQTEGRRLEFKEKLPKPLVIAKTIVAFANDAGGEIVIGIQDNPRVVVGLPEEELFTIEEQISNIIFDYCSPIIVPQILVHTIENKSIIRVQVSRGNNFPYFLKKQGKLKGTYVRIGSTNRLADESIIAELERQKRNISYDKELIYDRKFENIRLNEFSDFYLEKTNEKLTESAFRKLQLYKEINGEKYPTIACILLSNDELRNEYFHYAKIECARFKGTTREIFIDQKTIDVNISEQAEQAYEFVLRHINKSAKVEGVYTVSYWEYPIEALREVLRNAVVHRDYSLTGKDIKVAIYDDMIEVTSPGTLLPSINFNQLEAGQSDIRNKTLAPIFKHLGIIDQWGNGLQLISDKLKEYPHIEFKWHEVGMQFQVQFINRNFVSEQELRKIQIANKEIYSVSYNNKQQELKQELEQELEQESLFSKVLIVVRSDSFSRKKISQKLQQKSISGQLNEVLTILHNKKLIEWTIPEKPNSSKQKYKITQRGLLFLEMLEEKKQVKH